MRLMGHVPLCCRFLLLTLFAKKIVIVVSRVNGVSNGNEERASHKNLRHNNRYGDRFHRHVASKNEENDDCSVELSRDGMPPADVKRATMAIKLSALVHNYDTIEADEEPMYDEVFEGQVTRGVYYESGIDAVYTTRIRNKYCAVAFRATKMEQDDFLSDYQTNIDLDPVEFEMEDSPKEKEEKQGKDDALCDVHKGYHDAYFDFEYRPAIEEFLQTCSQECPECEIVLTGHSQGGGIAEIAALYYKKSIQATPENLYVITFGSPPALGAGCVSFFAKEERCRIFRYNMTIQGPFGTGLVYDLVPMMYPRVLGDYDNDGIIDVSSVADTYARHGGLAFLGHQLFLYADDPSALTLGPFDGHYNVGTSKYDLTAKSHSSPRYLDVLDKQNKLLTAQNNVCYLPTNGFSLGSLCNTDESDFHCVVGFSECRKNGWGWWAENTCQVMNGVSSQRTVTHTFCQKSPLP